MATLATPIRDESIYRDPACVKVVCNQRGRALYFSRSPIPCHRDGLPDPAAATAPVAYLHLGLYAYRRDFLLELGSLPPSRSRPPKSSSSSACSKPATRSPSASSTSRASASTHPKITKSSFRVGEIDTRYSNESSRTVNSLRPTSLRAGLPSWSCACDSIVGDLVRRVSQTGACDDDVYREVTQRHNDDPRC